MILFFFIPTEYRLKQNYPNPFNPSTTIEYVLPKISDVKITILNIIGQEVKTIVDEKQGAGTHSINFNAKDLPSGIYFYRLQTDDFNQVKKMVLIK